MKFSLGYFGWKEGRKARMNEWMNGWLVGWMVPDDGLIRYSDFDNIFRLCLRSGLVC